MPAGFRKVGKRTGVLSLIPVLSLCGCSGGVLDPDGPIGAAEKTILLNSVGIMLAIVVPTLLATLGVAWWFRASNSRAQHLPDWEFSGRIEAVVWSIPMMTVLLLGGIGWLGSHELDPSVPISSTVKPLKVEVVSLDWKWLFIYPDQGVASVNRLVIPAGTPIHFDLTSSGVMNSFFIPRLGSQLYTMAGMVTRLNLEANKPGSFPGFSAQFSGDGFSDMRFTVDVMPASGFSAWLTQTRGAGQMLDATQYAALLKPSEAVAPIAFRSVAPGLFQSIVHADMPSKGG